MAPRRDQSTHFLSFADELGANSSYSFALANYDLGLHSGLVEDFANGGADHTFDAEALLFLDRGLNTAELNEILRFDNAEHFNAAIGLCCPARGEAQRDARFRAIIDHDQVNALRLIPHVEHCCVKPDLSASCSTRLPART